MFTSITNENNAKHDSKHIYALFFDASGAFKKGVPDSLKLQDHVKDAFRHCYKGEGKADLFRTYFGTDLVDDSRPAKQSSVFQTPFKIVNGTLESSELVGSEWAITGSSISSTLLRIAFRFVMQYSKVTEVAGNKKDFTISDNYPDIFRRETQSLTYILSRCQMKLQFTLETLNVGDSVNSSRVAMWKGYVRNFFENDHYAALQVLTLPIKWKHVCCTNVSTPFGSFTIASKVAIKTLPEIPRKMFSTFVSAHGGGAQTMNSDYLFGVSMKDKYMDRLAAVFLLSKAKVDVSVIATSNNNLLTRYTFIKDVDLTGSFHDGLVDLSNPTQVGTNDRTLERQKRCSALTAALKRGIILKVVHIDELTEDYELPTGYAYARYPVPHQAKVVIFHLDSFNMRPIPLENIVKYCILGLLSRQYRWSHMRMDLVSDLTMSFSAEIVSTAPTFEDVEVDGATVFEGVVGPYDKVVTVPVVNVTTIVLNDALPEIHFDKQGATQKLSVKSEKSSVPVADEETALLRSKAYDLHSRTLVVGGDKGKHHVTSTTSTTTTTVQSSTAEVGLASVKSPVDNSGGGGGGGGGHGVSSSSSGENDPPDGDGTMDIFNSFNFT